MNDAEHWGSENSTEKTENWTPSENVRLVAAITKCNPLKPNWENVSELMKNQPEAKHRALNFFSPKNCCTHFQYIHNRYLRQSSGCDTKLRGCGASFSSDHLINVLAAEALLEKSQLLRKTPAPVTQSVTTIQNFTSDKSWGSASTSSSTLDIVPDAIFEDAVQFESPAESLTDDYFQLSVPPMDKNPKPGLSGLSGPAAIARKSNPRKLGFSGERQDETRHFSTLDSIQEPDSTSANTKDKRTKSPAAVRKSSRNAIPSGSSTANSTKSGGAPPTGTIVTLSSSQRSTLSPTVRKKKATRIAEISDKLVAAATASASIAPPNSPYPTLKAHLASPPAVPPTLPAIPNMGQPAAKKPRFAKVNLSYLMGTEKKSTSLAELQQRASIKKVSEATPTPVKPENSVVATTSQTPSKSTTMCQSSKRPVNRFLAPLKRPRRLTKSSTTPSSKADDHGSGHVVVPLPVQKIASQGAEVEDGVLKIQKETQIKNVNTNMDTVQIEETDKLSPSSANNALLSSSTVEEHENHAEILFSGGRGCGIPVPHLLPLDNPMTEANMDKGEIFQGESSDLSDNQNCNDQSAKVPEPKSNAILTSRSCTEYPNSSREQSSEKHKKLSHGQTELINKRVLRSSAKVNHWLASGTTEITGDHQNDNEKSKSKLDTPIIVLDSSSSSTSSNNLNPECTCRLHSSHQVIGSDSCSIHFPKTMEDSEINVEETSALIPEEELIFLFRQVKAFSSEEFYLNTLVGFPDGLDQSIKRQEPMDLFTVLKMIHSKEITTVETLRRSLTKCYTQAMFAHPFGHPVGKRAQFAMSSLTRLISEYSSPEILHKRFTQFQETGLVLLTPPPTPTPEVEVDINDIYRKRSLSPDIAEFQSQRKMPKLTKEISP